MRKIFAGLFIIALLGIFVSACEKFEPDEIGLINQPVIYGSYDIHQAYSYADANWNVAFSAEVALLWDPDNVLQQSDGGYDIVNPVTLSEWLESIYGMPACSEGPYAVQYRDEPIPAFCSGFMVGPDLIVTAGHCIANRTECSRTAFVFGYQMQSADVPVTWVPNEDVYFCDQIVRRRNTWTNDWAVIRVDRPIHESHVALPIRRSGAVEDDPNVAELVVVGHPNPA